MHKLSNTYIGDYYNRHRKIASIMSKIKNQLSGLTIPDNLIEPVLKTMAKEIKKLNISGLDDMISLVGKRSIIFINTRQGASNLELPPSLPVFIGMVDGKYKVVVDLTHIIVLRQNPNGDYLEANSRQLFALLQCGYIYHQYHRLDTIKGKLPEVSRVASNYKLAEIGAGLYTTMMYKAIDSRTSIGRVESRIDLVRVCLAYFFLTVMWEMNRDSAIGVASKFAQGTDSNVNDILKELASAEVESLSELCMFINNSILELSGKPEATVSKLGLTIPTIQAGVMRLFGPNMVPGMEFLPMFLHGMLAVNAESRLFKDMTLLSMVKKEIKYFSDELYKAIK